MSRRAPLAVFAGLVAVLILTAWLPFVRAERAQIENTPTLRPKAALAELTLKPRQVACIRGVEFSPRTQAARVEVTRSAGPGPPIELTARARGYTARSTTRSGYGAPTLLDIEFAPAPRPVPDGTLCFRNTGRVAVTLLANAEERALASQTVTLDGRSSTIQPAVTLQERRPQPLAARVGTLFDHVAAFRPFPVGTVSLWLLVVGLGLGVPFLVGLAFAVALRRDRQT